MFRAKFKIRNVEDYPNEVDPAKAVTMSAVTDGCEENKSFSKWTPSGSLDMYITNEAIFSELIVGKEFYLDFTSI